MIAPPDWAGMRIAIVGAAREGTALARYLATCGARVTLSDTKPASELTEQLASLQGPDMNLALGGAPVDLGVLDVLFVSPGVPPTALLVQEARALGLPVSSEPRVFTQSCAAPIVGITGSSGKTTTTALTGEMLSSQGLDVWVGGNIGTPLTERLLERERPDVAVMELSSFQLELFSPEYQGALVGARRTEASRVLSTEGWSPHIAAVTNITPNHLDRHPSMDDYVKAKEHILTYQRPDDWAVLNAEDARAEDLADKTPARVLWFSLTDSVEEGAFVRDDALVMRLDGAETTVCETGCVRLRGRHNLANVLTACCCARAAGASVEALQGAIAGFGGVQHRLEVVGVIGGVTYVNDSIATTPERSIAAIRAYNEPLVMLAGGRDKHLPWDAWADLAMDRVRAIVVFGEARDIIVSALSEAMARQGAEASNGPQVRMAGDLDEAVSVAASISRNGDVVLLSPGGTSFDAYKDFEERGRAFAEHVSRLD